MIRDIRHYQNRIDLMEGRSGRDNGNIIKKCKRKIAQLKEKESK
jgi:hypothetical protein